MVLVIGAEASANSVFQQTQTDQGISAFKSANYSGARRWLSTKEAAENPQAWYYLGRMYQEGLGGFAVDKQRAEKLFQQSAEKGVPEAMLVIADIHARGAGVRPNLAMARTWHERAARAGNVEGMYLYGRDLSSPSSGLPPDYDRARVWFEQAASAGHAEAMRSLGDLYRNGLGVDVSMVDALMWYRLAVKAGSGEAKTGEALLTRILPADKQASADALAREWEVLTGRAPAPATTQPVAPPKAAS